MDGCYLEQLKSYHYHSFESLNFAQKAILGRFACVADMSVVVVVAVAVVAARDCNVVCDYYPQTIRLVFEFYEKLRLQFAATFALRYSCPYKLQKIGLHDTMIPRVVSPFVVIFRSTLLYLVYLFGVT